MNTQEIIVSVILLSVFVLVLRYIFVLFKEEGKSGGMCSGCADAEGCPLSHLYKDRSKEEDKKCGK